MQDGNTYTKYTCVGPARHTIIICDKPRCEKSMWRSARAELNKGSKRIALHITVSEHANKMCCPGNTGSTKCALMMSESLIYPPIRYASFCFLPMFKKHKPL